jgi:HAMP domain-containing protein
MSIKVRLTALMILLILVPVSITAAISVANTGRSLTQQAVRQLESLADAKENEVTNFIIAEQTRLKAVTSRTRMRQLLIEYNAEPSTATADSIRKILADAGAVFSEIRWISLHTPEGDLVTSTGLVNDFEREDISKVFNKALNEEGVIFDTRLDEMLVFGPVSQDEEVIGVAFITIESEPLNQLFASRVGLGNTGEVLVAERNEFGDAQFLHKRRFELDPNARPIINKEALHVPMTQSLQGQETILFDAIDYRGEEVLAATRYLEIVDWGLVVKIDKDELLQSLGEFRNTLTILTLIILFVTTVVSYITTRMLTEPILRLTRFAEDVQEGDLSVLADTETGDEISVLGKTLNDMVDQVNQSREELEQLVQQKTRELNKRLADTEKLNSLMIGRENKMVALKKEIKELKKQIGNM